MLRRNKILLFSLFAFFSFSNVFAREMTIDELGSRATDLKHDHVNYIYIIGEYAFTDKYQLKTEDIMYASRSIHLDVEYDGTNVTEVLSKMNIQQVGAKIENWELKGWEVRENIVGKEKLNPSQKMNIKYIDYVLQPEKTSAMLNADLSNGNFSTYVQVLEKYLGFKLDESYENGKLTVENGKAKGLLLKNSHITLNKEDQIKYKDAEYYFAYVLEIPNATKDTKVTVSGLNRENEGILDWKDFDVTPEKGNGTTPGIVVLVPLKKEDIQKDPILTVQVDLDGNKKDYESTSYTIDLSELKFQEDSQTVPTLNKASDEDTKTMKGFNYDSSKNEGLALNLEENSKTTFKLTGIMKEQVLNEKAFGKAEATGYFFDFTLVKPVEVPKGNAKIETLIDESGRGVKKEFKQSEYDAEGNLTILKRFDPTISCKNKENCKMYLRVDWDGEGKEYLPTIYTIDYSDVTFEKSSLFEISALNKNEDNTFDDNGWLNKEGYSVTVEKDSINPSKYNVKGLLPIFLDEEWQNKNDPLDSKGNDYYLGLVLKLSNAPEGFKDEGDKMSIKFVDSDGENIYHKEVKANNFETSLTLYILKYLVPTKTTKQFEIIVDLDGEDGNDYAPYNITIDYTDLLFQNYSFGEVDFDVLKNVEESTPEGKYLKEFNFDAKTIEEVSTHVDNSQPDRPSKDGIAGKIKEQTLNDKSGFTNKTGYFVPIKIVFPTNEEYISRYKEKWTITVYDESGNKKTYTPTKEEYQQGWVLVLFRLDKTKTLDQAVLKYELDFDGKEDAFLPVEYTIKYKDLTFQTENKITFKYFDETTGKMISEDKTVYEGEKLSSSIAPEISSSYKYHKFDYWYKENTDANTSFDFEKNSTSENENITLKAHYTLNIDEFLMDVVEDLKSGKTDYSEDFQSIFEITKLENTITFKIKDSTALLNKMDETSIPGTIAYILQRGEIKDITLAFGDKKTVFTKDGVKDGVQPLSLDTEGLALKEKIKTGAKELFETVLPSANTMTLNQMAVEEKSYTLTIGELDETVKLKDDAQKEYKFVFNTDIAYVKNETELDTALKNSKIKNINIIGDFEVKKSYDLQTKITIDGATDKHTITANNIDNIFTVKSPDVVIKNVKLKDAKKYSVMLESGSLTLSDSEIIYTDVLPETVESGIEVKTNAKLISSNMKFDKEDYEHPLVKAEQTNATVSLTNTSSKQATKITKEKIKTYEKHIEEEPEYKGNGDTKETDSTYTYYNYYNNESNSKIYTTRLFNLEGGYRVEFVRLNYFNTLVTLPSKDDKNYKILTSFTRDGHNYDILGFSKTNNGSTTPSVPGGECTLPSHVTDKDQLKATEDATYYNAYCIKLKEGTKVVSNVDEFRNALNNEPTTHEIYIKDNTILDLSTEEINISKQVTIAGQGNNVTLKVKKMNITENEVFLQKLKIEMNPDKDTESLIDLSSNAHEFTLWQSNIKNISENNVKYAIKFSGSKAIADIRWNTFESEHITDSYIYIASDLAGGTDIYLNTFKAISGEKKSSIFVKKFDSSVTELDGTSNIRIGANTYNTDYAINFSNEISDETGFIAIDSTTEIKVLVNYDETHKNFGNIKFKSDYQKVKITYVKNGVESDKPDDGTPIQFIMEIKP